MPKIGLVTVLFKSDEVLEGFFKSIYIQDDKDYILYLVDNSWNKATNQLIEQLSVRYPLTSIQHINTGGNIGVAAGNNTGIRAALADDCTHVLILNNDIETSQSFLFRQLLAGSQEQGDAMVVPKIFYYDSPKLWMAGGFMDWWRALGVHYGMGKPDGPAYNQPKFITYAPTCFMLVPAQVFEKTGMMDEPYFAYYDDTDFVVRAQRAGCKLYYLPSLVILHKVSSSAGDNSPFYVYYSNRNKIYFIRRNMRGFRRWFAIGYTLLSRVAFWLRFDKVRKQKLVQGLKDGFRLPVKKYGSLDG